MLFKSCLELFGEQNNIWLRLRASHGWKVLSKLPEARNDQTRDQFFYFPHLFYFPLYFYFLSFISFLQFLCAASILSRPLLCILNNPPRDKNCHDPTATSRWRPPTRRHFNHYFQYTYDWIENPSFIFTFSYIFSLILTFWLFQ